MRSRTALLLAAGLIALLLILHAVGLSRIAHAVERAWWALPFMAVVHLGQLFLSASAWRVGLGALGAATVFRIRWVREGVNALLPVAQIGGQVVAVRLLVRAGLTPVHAIAGTVLDLTLEAAAQFVFTIAGIAILFAQRGDTGWSGWVGGGLLLLGLGVAGFVAAQRAGLLRLVERAVAAGAARWPGLSGWPLDGLHATLMRLQARPRALAAAITLHTVGWALGGAEVWIGLHVLGAPVGAVDAVVIESLGMAARSAGFVVPGAVGVQEGGFVLVAGLFGVSPADALALSVLKRLREVGIGVPALVAGRK